MMKARNYRIVRKRSFVEREGLVVQKMMQERMLVYIPVLLEDACFSAQRQSLITESRRF